MPLISKQYTQEDLDKQIALLEKSQIHRQEAQKLYAEKKIADGKIFFIKGATMLIPGSPEKEAWSAGVFINGKFIFVIYSAKDKRLKRLKRQGVAQLMEIVKTKMVDTRQSTMLPPRFQSLNNPDFVLHGATSKDVDLDSPTLKDKPQIFDPNDQSFQHPGVES